MKLLVASLLFAMAASGRGMRFEPILEITVRVVNQTGLSARGLLPVKAAAAEIFERAGIVIDWVDCTESAPCPTDPAPGEFWLQLLDRRPAGLSSDAMGYTLLTHQPHDDGSYAAASWDAVQSTASVMKTDPRMLLGGVVAHELGHLLLGSQAHARNGVMAARFGPVQLFEAEHNELHFERAQIEPLRAEIQRRLEQKF